MDIKFTYSTLTESHVEYLKDCIRNGLKARERRSRVKAKKIHRRLLSNNRTKNPSKIGRRNIKQRRLHGGWIIASATMENFLKEGLCKLSLRSSIHRYSPFRDPEKDAQLRDAITTLQPEFCNAFLNMDNAVITSTEFTAAVVGMLIDINKGKKKCPNQAAV